jgi:hypothetical protein
MKFLDALNKFLDTVEYDYYHRNDPLPMPSDASKQPLESSQTPPSIVDTLLPWENIVGSQANRHNVRVICDEELLEFGQKNVLTACVRQESDFYPLAKGKLNTDGTQDFGIAQFNNGKNRHGVPFWIGQGATFSSEEEVLSSPEKCIRVMARYYKATGNLNPWSSFNSYDGEPPAYMQWLGKV